MSLKEEKQEVKVEDSQSFKAKDYVVSTLLNTSLFVMMSFVTKGINLAFNVLIARVISKESYGLTTVYFSFIFLLLTHFSRETLRKTCLKFCPNENEQIENFAFSHACHLIWLVNFIVFLSSVPICLVFIYFAGSDESRVSQYKIHIFIYVLSAMIELIAEPAVIYLNVKIDKKYRLIGMTMSNYSRLILTYIFAYFLNMDLWAFTLSRLVASSMFTLYIIYVGIVIFNMHYSAFIPNYRGILGITRHTEIKILLNSFTKGTMLKMVLNYSERIVLSFFLQISDSAKAEYTFVMDNFHTFIKYIIEPAEENFYNLINKIKHYKDLTIIPSTGEFSGDFSKGENEILVKLYSNLKKKGKKDKESYSFKLLKLSLKLFSVFGVLLFCYLFIVGKELVILIFTEKWGTDHTIGIVKTYSLYVGALAITSLTDSYSNAICSSEKMGLINSLISVNAFLLITLSIVLSQYDITGLVWANILTLLLRFIVNSYLIINFELEDQITNHTNIDADDKLKKSSKDYKQNGYFSLPKDDKLSIDDEERNMLPYVVSVSDCIKWSNIISEMGKFVYKSFMKTSAFVSTLVCLIILSIIKDLLQYDNKPLLIISSGIILAINIVLIFMVEKKGFIDIIRLKSSSSKI
jgi:hypothetical protein